MQSCYFNRHVELYGIMQGDFFLTLLNALPEINVRWQEFMYSRNK